MSTLREEIEKILRDDTGEADIDFYRSQTRRILSEMEKKVNEVEPKDIPKEVEVMFGLFPKDFQEKLVPLIKSVHKASISDYHDALMEVLK